MSLKWNVNRLAVLTAISFVLGPLAWAQSATSKSSDPNATPAASVSAPTAPALTADQILENYIKAIGGRENWKKLTTRISTGTIDVPAMNLSGLVTVREKAPNRSIFTVNFNGAVFQQGFDGTIGWSNDPQNGLREQTGEELAETKRDSDFYHPLDLKQMYSKIAVAGTDKIDDRDAYVVEASSGDLGTDKIYFDAQNGLVLRIVGQHHTLDGPATFTEDFSDFREVDGHVVVEKARAGRSKAPGQAALNALIKARKHWRSPYRSTDDHLDAMRGHDRHPRRYKRTA